MLLILKEEYKQTEYEDLISTLNIRGIKYTSYDSDRVINADNISYETLSELMLNHVIEKAIETPTDLTKASHKGELTEIKIRNTTINKDNFTVIAGPCSVESYDSLSEIARKLKKLGINILRGGAYKLRTSPYAFQGLGKEGVLILENVCRELDMISLSEIVSSEDIPFMSQHIDILMVGTRNMQNFRLLSELGKVKNPILLKRGMSSTIEEWLMAAEYIIKEGNPKVILCERGIRTFETFTRNTLDLSSVAAVNLLSNLPVFVDPSHSTGHREMIIPMSLAAAAAGADGLIIEAHINPDNALTDKKQTIDVALLQGLISSLAVVIKIWGKVFSNKALNALSNTEANNHQKV